MLATDDPTDRRHLDQVRLVYHYRDGHDFVTETMLRIEAVAYMPVLQAGYVDPDHYEAAFATIELRRVSARPSELRLDGLGDLWAVPARPVDVARDAEAGRVVPVGPTEPSVRTHGATGGARGLRDRAEHPWVA